MPRGVRHDLEAAYMQLYAISRLRLHLEFTRVIVGCVLSQSHNVADEDMEPDTVSITSSHTTGL